METEPQSPRVALASLGCKLNQAEVQSLARSFLQAGYCLAQDGEPYDLFVLNTCTVTATADRKSRQLLRSAQRKNPQAFVLATGCAAQRSPQALEALLQRGLVVDNDHKGDLIALAAAHLPPSRGRQGPSSRSGRTRALVKIQSGCPLSCAYCVVPQVRGRPRSIPVDALVKEVKALGAEGYQEVVLTGTWPGGYGADWNGQGRGRALVALLGRLLEDTGVPRLRLPSLFPQDVTEELLELFGSGRLCRHLHLPLQSGAETTLRRMGRPYTAAAFHAQVEAARRRVPGLAITTDVIAGFPGEDDHEFTESLEFCRGVGFAALHVFPYSPRPGTEAAAMPKRVSAPTVQERARRLRELSQASSLAFRRGFLGQRLGVLWEEPAQNGLWSGLTDNYLRVFARGGVDLRGRLLPARLLFPRQTGVWGELEP